jgi:acetyltransferase-like isoleucine patch superfamily enzyme/GT2 family glycosyltransferase
MSKSLAPIVLFVYNRPEHTRQTLQALEKNELANESELFVFVDGPKTDADNNAKTRIAKVRELIRREWKFKSVQIIESKQNRGLANSIINGVTQIVDKYGKIIVLEDDLITAPGFLRYMNEALVLYENESKVMQISGYQFPIDFPTDVPQTFFLPLTTSWGWSTWKRAWDAFDPQAKGWEVLKTDKKLRWRFDLDGSYPYAEMLEAQMEAKTIDSWAIRWWWSVFKEDGISLFCNQSLVKNIGFGKESTHTKHNPFKKHGIKTVKLKHDFLITVSKDIKTFDIIKEFLSKSHNFSSRESKPIIYILNKIQHYLNKLKEYFKIGKKKKHQELKLISESISNIKVDPSSLINGANFDIRTFEKKIYIKIGRDCVINGHFVIENKNGSINIGDRTFIGGGLFISINDIKIGNDVMFSWGCTVIDNNAHSLDWRDRKSDVIDWKKGIEEGTLGKYKDWSKVISAPVKVCDKAWISFNVIILKGVTIGEGAVVAAGSVVTKDVLPYTLVAGNPARFIRNVAK